MNTGTNSKYSTSHKVSVAIYGYIWLYIGSLIDFFMLKQTKNMSQVLFLGVDPVNIPMSNDIGRYIFLSFHIAMSGLGEAISNDIGLYRKVQYHMFIGVCDEKRYRKMSDDV
jgi:hypothetical protein